MTLKMKTMGQVLVGVFVVWHAFAVATYAIPISTQSVFARSVRNISVTMTRGYVLSLSQWQQWNLFAPDPMRRVPSYEVQRQDVGQWLTIASINPDSFSWAHQATRYKLLIGMLEQDQETYSPLMVEHFLRNYCAPNSLNSGTNLRLVYRPYVVSQPANAFQAMRADPWPRTDRLEYFSDVTPCP